MTAQGLIQALNIKSYIKLQNFYNVYPSTLFCMESCIFSFVVFFRKSGSVLVLIYHIPSCTIFFFFSISERSMVHGMIS